MLRLITDFDGPIMDVSDRYYRVYQFCLDQIRQPDQPVQRLTKSEFWQMKRAQIPEREIGKRSGLDETQALEFARLRKRTVHTLLYLVHDSPIPGAVETLEHAQSLGIELMTMTMRRTRELDAALDQWNLARFFAPNRRYCLDDDHAKTNDIDDKTWLMGRALAELPSACETWMVGDTEADILSAKAHQIPIIAVLSGIRNQTQLLQHNPDYIVNNLSEAVEYLVEQTAVLK